MLLEIATWVSVLIVFGFALLQFLLTLGLPMGGMHWVANTRYCLLK